MSLYGFVDGIMRYPESYRHTQLIIQVIARAANGIQRLLRTLTEQGKL